MKLQTTLALLIFAALSNFAAAQSSFQFTDTYPTPYVSDTTEIAPAVIQVIDYHTTIHNVGTTTVQTRVTRETLSFAGSQTNYFCIDGNCLPDFVDVAPDNRVFSIAPGDSNTSFSGHMKVYESVGVSYVKYCFFDTLNPADSACINVIYEALVMGMNERFMQKASMGAMYPNPANDRVSFTYMIESSPSSKTLLIQDLTGKVIEQKEILKLQGVQHFETSNLAPGIYLATMILDGQQVAAKKFIVAR